MNTKTKIILVASAVFLAVIAILAGQQAQIRRLKSERDTERRNTVALLREVEQYKVRDSLSAARVDALELSLRDYKRFRAEDAALIKDLQTRGRTLERVNKSQAETIIALQSVPKDTVVVVKDSVVVPAKKVRCGDAWYDFEGIVTADSFTGTLRNRESLLMTETVKYKRFLGFLWRTGKVKDRRIDIVSRNPHTTITEVEQIQIRE